MQSAARHHAVPLLLPSPALASLGPDELLGLIAWAGDKHPGLYRRRLARTHIYALSLAVYFTSWTFYGAVGRATQEGLGFLPIYLGPLLVFVFGAPLLRRIIYISKRNNSTSIADFIASRITAKASAPTPFSGTM